MIQAQSSEIQNKKQETHKFKEEQNAVRLTQLSLGLLLCSRRMFGEVHFRPSHLLCHLSSREPKKLIMTTTLSKVHLKMQHQTKLKEFFPGTQSSLNIKLISV